jgi:hypothetical protein
LQGAQVDVLALTGQLLLDDDGVALGEGPVETMHFTERVSVETTGRRPLLKAGGSSGEITADGIAGDLQLTSNPLAPETLAPAGVAGGRL